ncbi:MAG: efflux RND transporter periplasmic adaptor subunit [Limisphaerales bacterium]
MPRYHYFLCLPLLTALLPLLTGCERPSESASKTTAAKPQAIELGERDVAEVTARILLSGVRVTGTLSPAVRLDVKAQVSGQIDSIYVDRGTVVTQSQVMAVSDDQAAKAQVESFKSQVAAAERDFNSSELLFKAGAASERTYMNSKVSLESAKAQLAQAQQTVERGTVKSPVYAVVSERLVSAGEVVSPGQRLFTVVNPEKLECAAFVLPPDVIKIRPGQKVLLSLSYYGDRQIIGQVERIDPVADPKSRRIGVYISIHNEDHTLVAGLFATGTVLTDPGANEHKVLVVPVTAVRDENGVTVAYAIESDRLVRRPLEVGREGSGEGLVEIRSGLKEGAKVVLSSSAELKEGVPVKILTAAKPQ